MKLFDIRAVFDKFRADLTDRRVTRRCKLPKDAHEILKILKK